ncbi:hypothetical protein FPRO04_13128 [Fusarium proliferatum]|nr:hypothetical protein FPRO03_11664 [Fusarium proliferatum]KAG4266762.1 hypothetical protein FPRO04_13128 [Fusarium proliferatum]KAI1014414.1 hypothetical protein LB504_012109 [Fusarium proliferatum]
MKFTSFLLGFAATAIASPISKRAVFSQTTYDDLSISGGTAGNAQQEALQKLGGLPTDLSTVEKSDLDFLNSRGKIKNKVLKLTATILKLEAQQAQGEDVADKLAEENKKLQNNISQDKDEAGKASTFLAFDATTS